MQALLPSLLRVVLSGLLPAALAALLMLSAACAARRIHRARRLHLIPSLIPSRPHRYRSPQAQSRILSQRQNPLLTLHLRRQRRRLHR